VREVTSSFRNAVFRWYSTVLWLMNSCEVRLARQEKLTQSGGVKLPWAW
jgi:hypothetical protein